jgi:tRNA threonylcarbamoyladenosine modification (KEOPS) complex  Pcc1 subunit
MEAIAEALRPEILHPAGEKARARITKRGKVLKLQFEARDSSALRAIMTSYLRLLGAAVNVSRSLRQLEVTEKTKRARKTKSKNQRDLR